MEAKLHQIKASAGSGKTYTLTKEYINNLLKCTDTSTPGLACRASGSETMANEILAITFTNSAASEMRERVIKVLKEAALGISKEENNGPEYPPLSKEDARKWIDKLLHDLNALNIRTIDSLMHLIVRSAALEHGLTPNFETVIQSEDALKPWLKHYLELARDNAEERKILEETLSAIIEYSGTSGFLCGEKLFWRLKNILEDTLTHKLGEISSAMEIRQGMSSLEDSKQKIIDNIQMLLELAVKEKLKINKSYMTIFERFAVGRFDDKCPPCMMHGSIAKILNKGGVITKEVEDIYANIVEKVEQYYKLNPIFNAAYIHRRLMDFIKSMVDAYIRDRIGEYKLPNFLVSSFALHTLDSDNGVPEALCRLGTRLKHFEIDEFQDTSWAQWNVLKFLVEEALSKGGSMTWVGDVKQSIYVFRDAEPSLFDAVRNDEDLLAIAPSPQVSRLKTNWRSKKNIVTHVNKIFGIFSDPSNREYTKNNIPEEIIDIVAKILPARAPENEIVEAALAISHIYADVNQDFKPDSEGGFVQCECINPNDEDVAAYAVQLISDMKTSEGKRRPYSDICILVRENKQATLLAEALITNNIPVVTENSLLLKEHPVIIQLLAFLTFMRDPHDNIAFWTILLGDIFLQHPIASEIDCEKMIALGMEDRNTFTYEQFKEKFPYIWKKTFAPFLDGTRIGNAYDAIMEWARVMQLEKRFPGDKTYIRRFMEIVLRAGNAGNSTPASFLEFWEDEGDEEKTPMPKSMNAVRIMTIHKAKGLQAPVIILPWTNFSVKPSDTPIVMKAFGATIPARISSDTAGNLYYPHMLKQAIEALNLFYVAITRAKEELYVLFEEQNDATNDSDKSISLTPFLHAMYARAGFTLPFKINDNNVCRQLARYSESEEDKINDLKNIHSTKTEMIVDENIAIEKPHEWLKLNIYGSHPESLEMTPAERGTFLHFCLQYMHIGNNPAEDAARALDYGLRHSTVPVPDDDNVRNGLQESLEWFAGLENAEKWLETGWREQPMCDEDGNILKADLIVPDGDSALVIDYKSGENYEDHIPQVRRYMECLEKTGNFPKKLHGMLIYLDQKKILNI